jgi:hypothetical protein
MMIFVFFVLAFFGLMMTAMPTDLKYPSLSATYGNSQNSIANHFSTANVTQYSSLGQDNMTYPYTSLTDAPSPPEWNITGQADHYLEVWWSQDSFEGGGGSYYQEALELRHTSKVWYGWTFSRLEIRYANNTDIGEYIFKSHLEAAWDSSINASVFYTSGDIATSIILTPTNTSKTIGEAWDDGEISYSISYELNTDLTKYSIWGFVLGLFSFQAIDLGVGGTVGILFNALINIPLTAATYYIFIKVTLAIIPFIPGLHGD